LMEFCLFGFFWGFVFFCFGFGHFRIAPALYTVTI
jgi:hypothetical protein